MNKIDAYGQEWRIKADGTEVPYRFYHRLADRVRDWWTIRDWRQKQKTFRVHGTRYYGDGGTIHRTLVVDVETYEGRVVGVWFRCQPLPFKEIEVTQYRALEMKEMYKHHQVELHGVEVKDVGGND